MIVDEILSAPVHGILSYDDTAPPSAAVLLCGPNPFLGGMPDNPVLRALAAGLLNAGALVLSLEYPAWEAGIAEEKFNRLRDQFWNHEFIPEQMPQDVEVGKEALRFLGSLAREWKVPLVAAGYSYGGALALQLVQASPCPVLAVSPPLRTLPPTTGLANDRCVLIRAREDLALSSAEVKAFEDRSRYRFPHECLLEAEDHFFLQELPRIEQESTQWLRDLLADR